MKSLNPFDANVHQTTSVLKLSSYSIYNKKQIFKKLIVNIEFFNIKVHIENWKKINENSSELDRNVFKFQEILKTCKTINLKVLI